MEQFHSESEGLRTNRADGGSSSLKANRLETEESTFQFKPEGKERPITQLKIVRQEEFPLTCVGVILWFYTGLQLIG